MEGRGKRGSFNGGRLAIEEKSGRTIGSSGYRCRIFIQRKVG